LSMTDSKTLDVQLAEDKDYEVVEATVVGGCDPHNHNTFENPDLVVEKNFDGCKKVSGNKFTLNLPAASVVEIRLK
ncbi:MAG: alpha-N-arabinofuranosidase, partial [Butyrivibrio sp.]|nr:alpha-N-arabinofuranosidase [Butyrivibrio sp.]